MNKSTTVLAKLLREESGQDLVEYALILGLVALISISGLSRVGSAVVSVFAAVGTKLNSVV